MAAVVNATMTTAPTANHSLQPINFSGVALSIRDSPRAIPRRAYHTPSALSGESKRSALTRDCDAFADAAAAAAKRAR